jgi:hypothetical protein
MAAAVYNGQLNLSGYPVWTTRSLTMVSPWGLGGVSAIAEAGRAASRRRMIVALKRMGSNDLKN